MGTVRWLIHDGAIQMTPNRKFSGPDGPVGDVYTVTLAAFDLNGSEIVRVVGNADCKIVPFPAAKFFIAIDQCELLKLPQHTFDCAFALTGG